MGHTENINSKSIILISGVNGFIGSNLCVYLIKQGYTVYGIIRNTSDTSHLREQLSLNFEDGFADSFLGERIYSYNSFSELYNISQNVNPDVLIHLAGLFVSSHSRNDIVDIIESNVTFSTVLVDACISVGCDKIISLSTYWENYDKEDYNPVNLYAATKKAFEDILMYYNSRRKVGVVILTVFDTFGYGDWRPKLMNYIRDLKDGSSIDLTEGNQMMHMVYIDDVCITIENSIRLIISNNEPKYEKYAILSDKAMNLREIIETYVSMAGKKIKLNWGRRAKREYEIIDIEGIGISLPFPYNSAPSSLKEGIIKYIGNTGLERENEL